MASSVRSSKTPRTIWSSRADSLSERAISAHAGSLNIVELGACRRERASLRLFARLFTTPSSLSHGKAAVHRIRFWRHCPKIGLESKPFWQRTRLPRAPEAIEQYEQALRIKPDFTEAQTALRPTATSPVSRVRRDAVFRENTAMAALGSSNRNVRESPHSGANLTGPFLS